METSRIRVTNKIKHTHVKHLRNIHVEQKRSERIVTWGILFELKMAANKLLQIWNKFQVSIVYLHSAHVRIMCPKLANLSTILQLPQQLVHLYYCATHTHSLALLFSTSLLQFVRLFSCSSNVFCFSVSVKLFTALDLHTLCMCVCVICLLVSIL